MSKFIFMSCHVVEASISLSGRDRYFLLENDWHVITIKN
jgi:hypothetical protein